MPKTILITGANGNVSTAVIAALKGSKNTVRAMVRDEAKAGALKSAGVEIVFGDFDKPETLTKAFNGVNTLWTLTSNGPSAPVQNSYALWHARKAGVSHIVRMSAVGAAHNAPTINSRLHALSDTELAQSGVAFTILKPHFFMQNLMMSAQSIAKDGAMYWAMGEGRMGLIDVRDIGEFAAKVLTSGGHEGKTYDLTGPASLNMAQIAEGFATALKKPVKYQPVGLEQAATSMSQMGMNAYAVNMMCDYLTAYSENWGDFVTNHFQSLMGKAPRSFADFARDFAPAFGAK